MDFSLNDVQLMLADSIEKFIANDYDFDARQKYAASDSGFSPDVWRTFADLGWTSVPFSEDDGGIDGGPIEMMVVMERLGRGLVVEPYLANIVLAGGVLKRSANKAQKEKWLQTIVAGDLQAALCFVEPQARYESSNVLTSAVRNGKQWKLNGNKTYVLNGGNADLLIVPARTSGEQSDTHGITLFAVDNSDSDIELKNYATVDGHQAAEIRFVDVVAGNDRILGEIDGGHAALAATMDDAILAICSEAVGIMTVLTEKTIEYSKSRVQFGVPISSFQALQHRMVEMYTACEQSRSLLMWAAMTAADETQDSAGAVSAMKYQIGTAGKRVAEEAVQIHGGMGVTWELDVAHYFKRLTAIGLMFGNADWHLDRLVAEAES